MPALLHQYLNGNTQVSIFDDGTKERIWEGLPDPIWPESMDCKITNYCDNPICVKWCHEKSNQSGKHADLKRAVSLFDDLPAGTELAIGGGNPFSHPDFEWFLGELKNRGILANVTVNSYHLFNKETDDWAKNLMDQKLIRGLGISYFSQYLVGKSDGVCQFNPNTVFHLIMGVHSLEDLRRITDFYPYSKVLLLGYKQYGNGETYYSERVKNNLYEWYVRLHEFFKIKNLVLSFDNLAIKQLNLRRFFPENSWNEFYMGNDGQFTMFLDLVERQYTTSSTSSVRFVLQDTDTTAKIFSQIRKIN